jgi:hypothetical protein
MSIRYTSLAIVLSRMNRWTFSFQVNDATKTRDLDEGIRGIRRKMPLPWNMKRGSLRVFDSVDEYAPATDHDELAYLDVSRNISFPQKAQFRYTSLKQFKEDQSNRNEIAEIFDGNQRILGVKYKGAGSGSQLLNSAENTDDWTASGQAASPTLEEVIYKEGNGSIRFTVGSSGTATVKNTFTSFSDANYKKKYHFKWVYLDVVPTSITLRLHVDGSNYLKTESITTQFSGVPFRADAWNLVAHDLNAATAVGTIGSTPTFAYEEIDLVGASAGTYYLDASYLRAWELFDYWYYSIFSVMATSASTEADQEFLFDSNDTSSGNQLLVGDAEWIDVIMYDALLTEAVEQGDKIKEDIAAKRNEAWKDLMKKYPSLEPVIVTNNYEFIDEFSIPAP